MRYIPLPLIESIGHTVHEGCFDHFKTVMPFKSLYVHWLAETCAWTLDSIKNVCPFGFSEVVAEKAKYLAHLFKLLQKCMLLTCQWNKHDIVWWRQSLTWLVPRNGVDVIDIWHYRCTQFACRDFQVTYFHVFMCTDFTLSCFRYNPKKRYFFQYNLRKSAQNLM